MSDSSSISSVFSAAPSAIGSCALSGEGESIFEGVYATRARLAGKVRSMAEAYGWRLVCSARAARGNARARL